MKVTIIVEGADSTATFEERIKFGMVNHVTADRDLAKLLDKVIKQAEGYVSEKAK